LTLRKPVPWDQVLDLVLRMNSLGMVYEEDIVRIATLATLKEEESLRQAALEAAQKSREAEKALEPLVTAYIPINYSDATADILPHLQNIITEDRGTVSVHTATNQIIIKDVTAKVEEAKILVSKLDIVTAQVLIEARVVEATKYLQKGIGHRPLRFGRSDYAGKREQPELRIYVKLPQERHKVTFRCYL